MTTQEITSVAIKVFAIYVLIQTILVVPTLIPAFSTYSDKLERGGNAIEVWGIGALAVLLLTGICVALWKLSNKVIDDVNQPSNEPSKSTVDEAFILSILGFYLTFEGLLRLAFNCVSAYVQANIESGQDGLHIQTIAYIIGYLIQAIVGITLILRAKGWVAFLRRLREAGLASKPSNK